MDIRGIMSEKPEPMAGRVHGIPDDSDGGPYGPTAEMKVPIGNRPMSRYGVIPEHPPEHPISAPLLPHLHPAHPPLPPIPPHKRRDLLQVTFDEKDWCVFKAVFRDEDTALAATEILRNAPPEIQLLAIQVLKMIEEVA